MESSPSPTDATARLGPYRLGRCLGRGGMGVVHEGLSSDGSVAAIKQLDLSEGGMGCSVNRFLDEAKLSASLQHANIVRTLGSGVDQGRAWLAMEKLEGATLSAVFRTPCAPMATPIALGIVQQVLGAFEY